MTSYCSIARARGLAFIILTQFSFSSTIAQSCPSSINSHERLQVAASDWTYKETFTTRHLRGVNIIEGPMHQDSGDDVLLRSTSGPSGESIWNFQKSIGEIEVWMQCIYEGSSIVLSKRVNSSVQQCSGKWSPQANNGKKMLQVTCQ